MQDDKPDVVRELELPGRRGPLQGAPGKRADLVRDGCVRCCYLVPLEDGAVDVQRGPGTASASVLAGLDCAFTIRRPDELRASVRALAERLASWA